MGEKRTDWQGREYTEVRDQSGNITRTYAEKDWKGDTVYRHTDANGRDLGTSREVRDWKGDIHTEHYDTAGDYAGRSDTYTDYKGDPYAVHRDAQGMQTGKSTVGHDWRGSYVHNTADQRPAPDYAPTQGAGGYAPSAPMARRGNSIVGAALFGIVVLLNKLTNLPYSIATKRL